MNRPDPNLTWRQLLAAYADRELDPAARRRVRSWLADHPGVLSELAAQRALSPTNAPFWEAASAERPDESTWLRVWNGIEAELDRRPASATSRRGHSPWWKRGLMLAILAVPTTAAAAALATLYLPTQQPARIMDVPDDGSEEVFQVAAVGDVEILSVREADVPQLVVGESPLKDSMTLVSSGDVRLEGLQPAWDGTVPEVQMGGGVDAPVIFALAARSP